jgi:tRNA (guanine-N7-)-methyltransferase
LLFKKLKPCGYLYAVTDWEDYGKHMLDCSRDFGKFKNQANGFSIPKTWRPSTSFEQKGKAKDHEIYELFLEKPDRLAT